MGVSRTLVLAWALAIWAGSALALTSSGIPCNVSGVTYDAGSGLQNSDACSGGWTVGNLTPAEEVAELNNLNFGGSNNWSFIDKFDVDTGTSGGFIVSSGGQTGTYTISGVFGYDPLAVILKGSLDMAFYLIDGLTTGGTWSTVTLRNPGGNIPNLSHISLLGVAAIPVPASAGLIALVLAGFGGARWYRRRRATAA